MRDYGKVHTSFWASETLQGCGDDARLLALYLLTCSHSNMAGAFRLPDAYASEDLGWTSERFRNGLAALEAAGFLSYCPRTKWVWIVKFLEWNRPENPNQWKAVAKFMAAIPENCSFKGKGFERVPEQFRNSPVPAPVPVKALKAKKESKPKEGEVTLDEWIAALDGAPAVPPDDPLFAWVAKQGIPAEWLSVAWAAFEDRYTGEGRQADKRYTKWRQAFRDHVKGGWLDVWRTDRAGAFVLTTAGEQYRRAIT